MNKSEFLNFYFSFKGRLNRRPYLLRFLLVWLVGIVSAALLDHFIFGLKFPAATRGYISSAWSLIALVPAYALACRRLHDFNYSGWWQIIPLGASLIGGIGMGISWVLVKYFAFKTASLIVLALSLVTFVVTIIWLFVLHLMIIFRKGTTCFNRFGNDPLEAYLVKDTNV